MSIFHNIYIAIIALIISIIIFSYAIFNYSLSAVSSSTIEKIVEIKPGGIDSVATTLYKERLIRSKWAFILYVKLTGKSNLKAATYTLSENMGTKKIVKILSFGKANSSDIKITFKEGWNIRKIASVIANNTNNTEDEFYNILNDKTYLEELINKYWFLSEDILNNKIYYSLEGYLYPNTYNFASKDVSIKTIIEVMLDEMDKELSTLKDMINNSNYSVHEILTLASIVELEGTAIEDRAKIAKVFLNRISANMNLGSDVTTFYGVKVDIGDRTLYSSEVSSCNSYNTRCATFKGLPISPVCNPAINTIEVVLNPDNNNYLYFVSDKNKKVYYSKTLKEQEATIKKLKSEGLWLG